MPTTMEGLVQLGSDLRDLMANLLGLRGEMQALRDSTTNNATTIINQFLGRPPSQQFFIDPVNGNDANDGQTAAKPKKDIDAILDSIGTTSTSIFLLADTTIRRRRNVYASLAIRGVQPSNQPAGYTFARRTLTFLATAENSPHPISGTFSSGLWLLGQNYISDYIDYLLPDQPAGQTFPNHIESNYGCTVAITSSTLLVATVTAQSLFGSSGNKFTAFIGMVFGTNAAGHLFKGITAGANPNGDFRYTTNITAA